MEQWALLFLKTANACLPYLIAFLTSITAIYADCYQIARKRTRNVPRQVYSSGGIMLLGAVCGGLSIIAFAQTNPDGQGLVDSILSLHIKSEYLRALYVGALILVIIRSKFFDLKNAPFGVEYFYKEWRLKALSGALLKWQSWRDTHIEINLEAAFRYGAFFDRLVNAMTTVINLDDDPDADTKAQLEETIKKRPPTALSSKDEDWKLYYRALTRLTLDTCGLAAFNGFPNFRRP